MLSLLLSFFIFQMILLFCFNNFFQEIKYNIHLQNQYASYETAAENLQSSLNACFDSYSEETLLSLKENHSRFSQLSEELATAFKNVQFQDTCQLAVSYLQRISEIELELQKAEFPVENFSLYRDCTHLYELLLIQYPSTQSAWNDLIFQKNSLIFSNWNLFNIFIFLMIGIVLLFFWFFIRNYIQETVYPLSLLETYAQEIEMEKYHQENSHLLTAASYSEAFVLSNAFIHMENTIKSQVTALQEKIELSRKVHLLEMENMSAQVALAQTENSLMQSLINPHFLFNCLNLLASCAIIENAPQVHQYCLQIADYLRSSLNYNGKNVSLKKEFSFIQQYAEIQKLRFGSRITFDFQCDTSCEDSIIPAIILQPLVENSLIHGVGDYLSNAVITVHAARSLDQKVLITVKDNGNGISPEQLEHIRQTLDTPFQAGQKGTGMRSVYYRLNYYFHGNITFEITSDKNSSTTLCISFPYQT